MKLRRRSRWKNQDGAVESDWATMLDSPLVSGGILTILQKTPGAWTSTIGCIMTHSLSEDIVEFDMVWLATRRITGKPEDALWRQFEPKPIRLSTNGAVLMFPLSRFTFEISENTTGGLSWRGQSTLANCVFPAPPEWSPCH